MRVNRAAATPQAAGNADPRLPSRCLEGIEPSQVHDRFPGNESALAFTSGVSESAVTSKDGFLGVFYSSTPSSVC